jgi:hypothetical protein
MKVLIVSNLRQTEVRDMPAIPCVGERIDVFYERRSSKTVTSVVWSPSKERLRPLNADQFDIVAVICVE